MTSVGYKMEKDKPLMAQTGIVTAPPSEPIRYSTQDTPPKAARLLRAPSLSTNGDRQSRPIIIPPKNTERYLAAEAWGRPRPSTP